MAAKNPTKDVKIIIIGDTNVGKTCLLLQYIREGTLGKTTSTVGCDAKVVNQKKNGYDIKATIWDTAGQERFRTITRAFYRGAMGVVVVYDVTKEESFNNISEWLKQVRVGEVDDRAVIVIVGNKTDMNFDRKVERQQGEEFAQKFNHGFFETSAKEGTNIDEVFDYIFANLDYNIVPNLGNSGWKNEQSTTPSCCGHASNASSV